MGGVSFYTRGLPVSQGSMRAGIAGNGRAYVMPDSSAKLKAWRKAIADSARTNVGFGVTVPGPVAVTMTFYLPKPKSRPKKDQYPDRKPDLDKLVRAALDAISKDVPLIEDDARVVSIAASKVFAGDPEWVGLSVSVEPVEPIGG